eukprot:485558_1
MLNFLSYRCNAIESILSDMYGILIQKRWYESSNKSTINKLTNFQATQLMQKLNGSVHKNQIISQAFDIYKQIEGKRNFHSINALLKIISHYDPKQVTIIWNDIKMYQIKDVSQQLLLKCCINTLKTNKYVSNISSKYIEILKYIETNISNTDSILMKTNL